MSIQVKEVAFIYHVVTNVAGARKFYEGLLGLKVGLEAEIAPGKWWIEYDIAGQALGVSNMMPGKPSSALVLEVADLDAALADVKATGATVVTEPMEFPRCRMFQLHDPDGNEITLHQRKAQT